MERLVEVFRIQKEEMRAEREIEAAVCEWQCRQRGIYIAAVTLAAIVIRNKGLHRCRSNSSKLVDVADPLSPDEVVGILPRLVHHQVVYRSDALLDVFLPESVERIA